MTPPPTGSRVRARLLLAVGAAVAVGVLAFWTEEEPVPARPYDPPPRAALERTHLHVQPGKPLTTGVNTLWCATLPLAWDALAEAAGGGPLEVGPPANSDDFAALAAHPLPAGTVASDRGVVRGGRGPGVVTAFAADVRTRLGDAFALPDFPAGPDDLVALAALRVELPFAVEFEVPEEPMAFAGGEPRVTTFGIPASLANEATERMRALVRVYGDDPGPDASFAVALETTAAGERILLARMPRPATLDAGWAALRALLARPATPFGVGDRLSVPRVHARVERLWSAWAGAPIRGPKGEVGPLRVLGQRVDLTLDERGARVESSAGAMALAAGRAFRFDRPFLLALAREGAERPYLLAWFENDDLFRKVGAEEPR
ncbi:MAG: hypothetical protein U1E39_17130 [Planctomycetota bacterium]